MKNLIFLIFMIFASFQVWAQNDSAQKAEKSDLKKEKRIDVAIGYNDLGVYHLERGGWRLAKKYFKKAFQLDPNFPEAYLNRGRVLAEIGRIQRALMDFNKALRLDSTSADALINRGIIFGQSGQSGKAIKDFTKALKLNPYTPSVDIFYNRGMAWNNSGKYDKAIEDFNRVIYENPYDAEAHNVRGIAWALKKKYGKALKDFKKSLELDPNMAYETNYNIKLALEAMQGKQTKKSYRYKHKVIKRKRQKTFLNH